MTRSPDHRRGDDIAYRIALALSGPVVLGIIVTAFAGAVALCVVHEALRCVERRATGANAWV